VIQKRKEKEHKNSLLFCSILNDTIEEISDAVMLLKVVEIEGEPNAFWILDEMNMIRKI
jgi:hypothetical protein